MADSKSLFGAIGRPLANAALDPRTGLVGRTFERTQGCWNCIHSDFEKAKELWKERRQIDLEHAMKLALESPIGEEELAVRNIRRMVDLVDTSLATGDLTRCVGPGVDANDNPVGDLVKISYLCRKWSAKQGASVARAGQSPDPLPMELEDKK